MNGSRQDLLMLPLPAQQPNARTTMQSNARTTAPMQPNARTTAPMSRLLYCNIKYSLPNLGAAPKTMSLSIL